MRLTLFLYSLALGILIVATIGLGVETFYPSPKPPQFPQELNYQSPDKFSPEQVRAQKEFDQRQKDFEKQSQSYNQPVSIFLILTGVVILALASYFLKKMEVIVQGVTAGGVFTLFYGIGRSFSTNDPKFPFIGLLIALAAVFFVTYRRLQVASITKPVTKTK